MSSENVNTIANASGTNALTSDSRYIVNPV